MCFQTRAPAFNRRVSSPMDITEALADGEADKDAAHTSGLDFFVVGIGASAGGLGAIKSLLEGLPATPDMAFVVVLHLSPTHESNASAIFQSSTRMPVTQVEGRIAIERNHVYVIPPGNDLEMFDGMLQLVPSKRQRGRHVVIDHFFRTLAETHRTRAVGIVLSGTGSDGSVGIAALKEKGGIVLAQTPEDAEHDGMPASAIATRQGRPRAAGRRDGEPAGGAVGERRADRGSRPRQGRPGGQRRARAGGGRGRAEADHGAAAATHRPRLPPLQAGDGAAPDRAADAGQPHAHARRLPPLPAGGFGRGQEAARRHADRRDPVLPRPAARSRRWSARSCRRSSRASTRTAASASGCRPARPARRRTRSRCSSPTRRRGTARRPSSPCSRATSTPRRSRSAAAACTAWGSRPTCRRPGCAATSRSSATATASARRCAST